MITSFTIIYNPEKLFKEMQKKTIRPTNTHNCILFCNGPLMISIILSITPNRIDSN